MESLESFKNLWYLRHHSESFGISKIPLESLEPLESYQNLWNLESSEIYQYFLTSQIFGIFGILLEFLESYWSLWNLIRIFRILTESFQDLWNLWNPIRIFRIFLGSLHFFRVFKILSENLGIPTFRNLWNLNRMFGSC